MSNHAEKMESRLMQLSAEYFNRETNRQSLITVTDFRLSSDGRRGTIVISVLPDDKAPAALDFAQRQLTELRQYMMEHLRARHIPWLEIKLNR
jgi:ribosome-binding factor A